MDNDTLILRIKKTLENCTDSKQFNLDVVYLRMAYEWAQNSYCKRSKVGCLVVSKKTIISDGYNGTPTGFPNDCEDCNNITLPYVLHAEANAITKLAKNSMSSENSTMYITLSPCYDCAKLIIQSGIKRVVFSEIYRKTEAIEFLISAGIELVYIEMK
jgi:dCMP deaminase